MAKRIEIFVETAPFQIEKAFTILNNIEVGENDNLEVYWDKDTTRKAIAMLAMYLGEEVTIDGKPVAVEL